MLSNPDHLLAKAAESDELVVFVHIFKAAGTSIKVQLCNHFGEDHVHVVNDGLDAEKDFDVRVPEVMARNRVSVLTGHFQYSRIAPVLAQTSTRRPRYFSFVRDPLDRLISAYNYFHMTKDEKWHKEARLLNIERFYHFIVENDPELCVNHQCRHLSETGVSRFEAVVENIDKNFAFVGTTEGLSQITREAQARLGFAVDVSIRLNASERVVDLVDLPNSTVDFLRSISQEDQKLHEYLRRGSVPV